jgi:transketolase
MVHNVNSGHPGSLGCTEFMALYQNLMDRKEGFDMDGIEKIFSSFQTDIFSPVFYSVLARSGYFVSELATFRLINSRVKDTQLLTTVYQLASGSLGQGMSVGIELLKLKN